MKKLNKIIIICGHYGSGKTTVSLNMAANFVGENKSVSLIDLDIVNPYFRSSDYTEQLTNLGIDVIPPEFAGTTLDVPALSPRILGAIESDKDHVIIDAGGDDAGATALGSFSDIISKQNYDMLYVVNQNRALIADPAHSVAVMREIEAASKLLCTGIINNTHLGELTTAEMVEGSTEYADAVANLADISVVLNSYDKTLSIKSIDNSFPMEVVVKPPWQNL